MVEFTAGTTERTGTESPTANVPYLDFPGDLIFQLAASYVPANNEGKLHYEITGGADAGLFTIVNDVLGEENWANLILHGENWSGGRVDYETNLAFGGGTYAVDVTVTSTLNGAQSTGSFFITVEDYSIVNWTTFHISGGGNPIAVTDVINATIDENTTNGTELFDVEATDGSGSPVYSLSADSSNGAFEIDADTGVVSVKDGSLIDFETVGSGYVITVKATENANDFVTRDFTIGGNGIVSITDVAPSVPVDNDTDDNEVFENIADATVGVMAFATDVAGGDVRYSVTDTRFVIDEVTGIVKVAPDGFPLGLDFESTPSIDLEVTASTVNGGLVSKQTFTINVMDANDAPVMFQQTLFADENQTSAGTPTVTDQDNDTLTYELTGGGADASFFTIDENTGELSFNAAQDFEDPSDFDADGTYAVEVKVNDGNGSSATETVFVALVDKNEAPVIDEVAFNASENIAGAADVFAADPDSGDSIEYTITGGADQTLFTIGAGNGFLDFLSAPDFENKTDADTDGVYEVEVTATDEGGLSDTQLVKITVTDANDAPQITSTAFDVKENIKVVETLTVTDQDPADTAFKNFFVTGGADGALFTVDSQTGELSFLAAPDFENAKDADEDNVYEVEVSVSDQNGTPGKGTVLVTVTDVAVEPGETITGTTGADTIDLTKTVKGQPFPTSRDDTIHGLGGNDTINGLGGDDKVFGGAGMDLIHGNIGADELDGDGDADTVTYVNSDKGVTIALDGIAGTGGDADGDKLTEIENLTGSQLGDGLTGSAVVNKIDGGLGDDLVDGGAGNDMLDGGAGLDTLDYSYLTAGQNLSLTLGVYNSTTKIVAQSSAVVKFGAVTLETDGVKNFENVLGGNGNDTLTGNAGVNELFGAEGDDLLTGGAGADKLDGGEADETTGDTVNYAASAAGVFVDLNVLAQAATHDFGDSKGLVANGDAAGDTLTGIENFIGSSKNDVVVANGDVNLLNSGLGTGIDTASYANSAGGIEIDLSKQFTVSATGVFSGGTAGIGGDAQGDKLAGFENVIGGAGDDIITGNDGANVIEGGDGIDTLDGGKGTDTVSYASATGNVQVVLNGAGKGNGNAYGESDALFNFENAIGSDYDDNFDGDSANNYFVGGAGTDTFAGGGGGTDTFDGGAGVDQATFTGETFGLTILLGKGGASATVKAAAGSQSAGDKLINIETLRAGSGNDVLTGNNVGVQLYGNGGNDTLTGSTQGDILDGGSDNDVVYMTVGHDILFGGDGIDTLNMSKITVGMLANIAGSGYSDAGATAISGNFFDFESIIGTAKDDELRGATNVLSTLNGADGNDIIEGGTVGDTLIGGNGTDTLSYANSAAGVSVTLRAGLSAITGTGGDDKGDIATGFEILIGSVNNDTLTGDSGANVIEGGKGADTLVGGGGNDTLSYAGSNGVSVVLNGATLEAIVSNNTGDADDDKATGFINLRGGAGGDILGGDSRNNEISGGGGNDVLTGGLGADTLDGGADHDTVNYSLDTAGLTVILGKNGASATVTGGTGSSAKGDKLIGIEEIDGSSGNDKLTGNDLFHRFDGGAGNDTLTGSTGSSTLHGDAGDDTIFASAGAIELYDGGSGAETSGDTLSFAKITTFGVDANLSTANLSSIGLGAGIGYGQVNGFEILVGGSKNDVLTGNAVTATKIDGGAGNDTITGGTAVDTLKGGAGNDTFVFANQNQSKDVFTDFTNGDKLQINKAGFAIALAGATLDADYFVLGAAATAVGHGQFIYNTVTDTLSWDYDGTGANAAVDIGQFGGAVVLKLADFALV